MKFFYILVFIPIFNSCINSNETDEASLFKTQKQMDITSKYKLGKENLLKGDSIGAYWTWSVVEEQLDSSFSDTIKKYKLRKYIFTQ